MCVPAAGEFLGGSALIGWSQWCPREGFITFCCVWEGTRPISPLVVVLISSHTLVFVSRPIGIFDKMHLFTRKRTFLVQVYFFYS